MDNNRSVPLPGAEDIGRGDDMAILLVGGGGLIGTSLVRRLCSGQEELVVYSAHMPRTEARCAWYQGDVTDLERLIQVYRQHRIECVIHNAGISSPKLYLDDPYKIYQVNVVGLLNSLEAARSHQVPRFLYISSAGVYGPDSPMDVREEDPRKGNLPYRASKICGEELVRNYGMDSVSLRVSYVYGPGRSVACPIRKMAEELFATGAVRKASGLDQKQDFIYVEDVSAGIQRILQASAWPHREYNLASGVLTSFRQVLDVFRRRYPGYSISMGPGKLGFTENSLNISRIRADFGWEPRMGFEEGMEHYLEWLERELSWHLSAG